MARPKKKPPSVTPPITIRLDDCGGYYQVYWINEHGESKLGNIYPPGFKLFDQIKSELCWVAEDTFNREYLSESMKSALCGLLVRE